MKLTFSKNNYRDVVKSFSFENFGDSLEKNNFQFLVGRFPLLEEFWKKYIIPATQRIEPGKTNVIRFREDNDRRIEKIASHNYSVFCNLVFAHLHLDKKDDCFLQDFYMHLAATCDLAEIMIIDVYLLLLSSKGEGSKCLQRMTKEEFLKIAGNWFDEEYEKIYSYYLNQGKKPKPIRFPGRDDILVEYLGKEGVRKKYAKLSNSIRAFRNKLVHDIKIGILIDGKTGIAYMPRPEKISEYGTWNEVFKADINDFVKVSEQTKKDVTELESILNEIWGKMIEDLDAEFFSEEHDRLRSIYNIKFTEDQEHFVSLGPPEMTTTSFENSKVTLSGEFNPDSDNFDNIGSATAWGKKD